MRRSPRLGLTTRGSALLTAGVTAAICGIALGQRDLVRVAFLLMAAPVAASLIVSRSRVSVSCARSVEPDRVTPGSPVLVRLSLTNQSLLPTGSLMLEDNLGEPFGQRARFTLDSLRGRESRSLAYHLPQVPRGRYRVGPLTMRLTDPFGLVERARSFRSVSDVVVLPVVDRLPETSLPGAWDSADQAGSHSVGSHGSDDASIREYRYGDDLRKVHWRSTARRGSVMVRQEERPWHGRTTLLLDTRVVAHRSAVGADDPGTDARLTSSFEWAVSAAASIAVHVSERGRPLDVMAGAVPLRVAGVGQLLDQLAALPASNTSDLGHAIAAIQTTNRDSTIVAVLGILDASSLSILSAAHRSHGSALALLIDSSSWSPETSVAEDVRDAAFARAELALTGAGWRVQRVMHGTAIADAWAGLLSGSLPRSRPAPTSVGP